MNAGGLWALGEALIELIETPILRSRLGGQARVRAVQRHSIERKTDEMESIYRAVVPKVTSPALRVEPPSQESPTRLGGS